MKILLIQPPLEDFYTTPIRLYPLGILYAAGVLQSYGIQVGILDCLNPLKKRKIPIPESLKYLEPHLAANPHLFRKYYRFGIREEEIVRAVCDFGPDAVGISSQFTAYFKSVADVAAIIKSCFDVPVFIGGNHATVFADQIQSRCPHIDDVLHGPAEESIPRYLQRFGFSATSPDWREIQLPRDMITGQTYRIGKKRYISLTGSRGCPFACEFCSVDAMFGRRIQYRAIDQVIQEMVESRVRVRTSIFNFEDDNLSFDRSWFAAFLDAVSETPELAHTELTAMNGLCHAVLDDELVDKMKTAGFQRLNLSLVTKDSALQKRYGRPGGRHHLEGIIRRGQELGMHITVYFIMGLPDQTREEVKDTIDYLFDRRVLVGPSVFYLPPGSRLYNRLTVSADLLEKWELYRSSAFAVETAHLKRKDLVDLFTYTRVRNLETLNRASF